MSYKREKPPHRIKRCGGCGLHPLLLGEGDDGVCPGCHEGDHRPSGDDSDVDNHKHLLQCFGTPTEAEMVTVNIPSEHYYTLLFVSQHY